jgi:hypothetical protein
MAELSAMAIHIEVTELADGEFEVEVRQDSTGTRHRVTVPPDLPARLGDPDVDRGELVRQSFVFLLDREPATSIMSKFSLDVIPRYFPDYFEAVRGQLDL